MGKFDGKVALITGAASGLGRASAERFAAEGAAIVCADLNAVGALEVANRIADAGRQSLALELDVTDYAACEAAVTQADARFGRLDVLLTCAGVGDSGFLHEMDPVVFARTMTINVNGTYHCAKAAFPLLARQGGTVVTVGSVAGLLAAPGFAAYGASKAAVIHLTRILAAEGARQQIRCNCICPSWIWTPMVEQAATQLVPGVPVEAARAALARQAPLRRMGKPEEFAAAAVFLASDDSSFVTGTELVLDGGMTLGARPM